MGEYYYVDVSRIVRFRNQPRIYFDEQEIQSLSETIKAPILADSLSQLRFNKNSSRINVFYDNYINSLKIEPDIILRFGDKPISKKDIRFARSQIVQMARTKVADGKMSMDEIFGQEELE